MELWNRGATGRSLSGLVVAVAMGLSTYAAIMFYRRWGGPLLAYIVALSLVVAFALAPVQKRIRRRFEGASDPKTET